MTNLIPETAPFSSEQRAWLNGFFTGLLGSLDANHRSNVGQSLANSAPTTILSPSHPTPIETELEEEFPWHDSSLAIVQRMRLAEAKPLARRMMAAMAQLDCGACGYLCKTYSEAIANGSEKCLTLCSPGGSETSKALRQLANELNAPSGSASGSNNQTAKSQSSAVGSRDNPVTAKLLNIRKLNKPDSAKDTRHIEIDLRESALNYCVGDALGVYPSNCAALVDGIVSAARFDGSTPVEFRGTNAPVEQVLVERCCLRQVTASLVERLQSSCSGTAPQRLATFHDSEEMDEWDVLELLEAFPAARISAQELVESLSPLRPRLYSIASSQNVFPNQVHLTVGRVENSVRGRIRKGVASTMFADRAEIENSLRIFVQPSRGFTVPANDDAPMIMVGPGTGIAPFIAFLQEREHRRATGRNWLFFGDQHRASDFLYREELEQWNRSGLLTRLDTAFSRDAADKVYVQHRMQQNAAEVFRWLDEGAYVFVCGDASRMAVDVDTTLHQIVETEGRLSSAESKAYIAALTDSKRYERDVY